jgi:SAM-dependent methyltransferase
MLETDKVFAGSIPENYDRYMVPLIFEPYAADMARRAASLSPGAVLETAAGSGVVTRALAPRLPRGASYVVTDLNQPMVDYAASRQPPDPRIEWRQASRPMVGTRRERAALPTLRRLQLGHRHQEAAVAGEGDHGTRFYRQLPHRRRSGADSS